MLIWQTAWLLILDLAAFGVGWAALRHVRKPSESTRTEVAAESLVLGMAILGTLTFALGLCGLFYPAFLIGLVLAAAAFGGVAVARGALSRGTSDPASPDLYSILAFLLLFALGVGCYLPVLAHDTLIAHFSLPTIYLDRQGLVTLPYNLFANMPHNVHVLYVLALAGGGFTTAKLLIVQFGLLTLIGFRSYAARYLSAPLGGIMGLLYLGGPLAQWHFGAAYIEPAIGCVLLYALLSLFRWRDGGRTEELLLFSVLMGWALGAKYTAWLFGSGLMLYLLVQVISSLRAQRIAPKWIVLAAALLALPVLPWLIRAWIVTGNPLYPNLPALLGGKWWSVIQGMQYQRILGVSDLYNSYPWVWEWARIPWNLIVNPNLYNPVLMTLVIAAPFLPRSYRNGRWGVLMIVYPGILMWAFILPTGRYLMGAVPFLVIGSTLALEWIARKRLLWIATQCAILLTLVTHTALLDRRWKLLIPENRERVVERHGLKRAWGKIDSELPPSAKLMLMFENRALFLERDYWMDSVYDAPSSMAMIRETGSASGAALYMKANGITHLVVNRGMAARYMSNVPAITMADPPVLPWEQFDFEARAFNELLEAEATFLFDAGAFSVYSLVPPAPDAPERNTSP